MRLGAHLAGLALAAAFTPATLLLCEALNRLGTAPKREGQAREVSFQVARAPQAPRKASTAPRPEERRAPAARGPRAALPPAPALGGDLGGVDLGLSDFALVGDPFGPRPDPRRVRTFRLTDVTGFRGEQSGANDIFVDDVELNP